VGYSQWVTDLAEREIAAHRLRMEAKKVERKRQKKVASACENDIFAPEKGNDIRGTSHGHAFLHRCIANLDAIRSEAGDFTLRDFSDYWAPDNRKTTPNGPNTFVPNRLVNGSNPLWAPFYDRGLTRRGTDGSLEADPDHPPFFRVSQELLGRMLHKMKRQYVDSNEKRKIDKVLSDHIDTLTAVVKGKVSGATHLIRDQRQAGRYPEKA
jgi:hypothetical protein